MKATMVPPHENSPGKQISSDSKVMSCGEGPDICSLISPTLNQETGYGTIPNPCCPEIYSIHSTRDGQIRVGDGALICLCNYIHKFYNCLNLLVLEIAHYCYSNRHDRCAFHFLIFKYLSHHKTMMKMISDDFTILTTTGGKRECAFFCISFCLTGCSVQSRETVRGNRKINML